MHHAALLISNAALLRRRDFPLRNLWAEENMLTHCYIRHTCKSAHTCVHTQKKELLRWRIPLANTLISLSRDQDATRSQNLWNMLINCQLVIQKKTVSDLELHKEGKIKTIDFCPPNFSEVPSFPPSSIYYFGSDWALCVEVMVRQLRRSSSMCQIASG